MATNLNSFFNNIMNKNIEVIELEKVIEKHIATFNLTSLIKEVIDNNMEVTELEKAIEKYNNEVISYKVSLFKTQEELEKLKYDFQLTLDNIDTKKTNTKKKTNTNTQEDFSDIEFTPDEETKPTFANVASNNVNTQVTTVIPPVHPVIKDYTGEIISTFNSKIDGTNMKDFLEEMAIVSKELKKSKHVYKKTYALIGTSYNDIFIIATNIDDYTFDTDITNTNNSNKIDWNTNVPINIYDYVKKAIDKALYDNNENNVTEDLNSKILVLHIEKNDDSSYYKEKYRVYCYKYNNRY